MKAVSNPITALRLLAVASLVLAVFFPGWAAALQDAGGYYGFPGGGGNAGGGSGGATGTNAAAIPTLSYWMLGIVSIVLVVLAALQRTHVDHKPKARANAMRRGST